MYKQKSTASLFNDVRQTKSNNLFNTNSRLAFGFLGLAVSSFVGAVAFVVYLSTTGTYIALSLVLLGSFLMLISAMVRERVRSLSSLPQKTQVVVEDEEAPLNR